MTRIRPLQNGINPLRGGDLLVTPRGIMMTLGVAWTMNNDKQYGLTVAHSFDKNDEAIVGTSVYAINTTADGDDPSDYKLIRIGTVASIDIVTDSTVIEIFSSIKTEPLAVALSGGDEDSVCHISLPIPGNDSGTAPPPLGTKLAMFGAARRGMIGKRVSGGNRSSRPYSDPTATFGVQSFTTTNDSGDDGVSDGKKKLSIDGDCGALYLDQNGTPCCMHTTLHEFQVEGTMLYTSYGVTMRRIVNTHPFYFGGNEAFQVLPASSSSSFDRQQSSSLCIEVSEVNGPMSPRFPKVSFPDDEIPDTIFYGKQPAKQLPLERLIFPDDDDEENSSLELEEEKKCQDY